MVSFEQWEKARQENSADQERQAGIEAVVIAAPMSNDRFMSLIQNTRGLKYIIDLRGEDELSLKDGKFNYLSFSKVVAQIEAFNTHAQAKTQAALSEIKERTEKFRLLTIHRPQGWDDLWS
ncbi:MAG: hypothetical protein V4736_01130 [Bdellovibrionota bacterium]